MKANMVSIAVGVSSILMITSSNAATINLTQAEVSAGLSYTIGFGPEVTSDASSVLGTLQLPAITLLDGYIEGTFPLNPPEFNSIGVSSNASGSIAFANQPGVTPAIFGTSQASLAFETVVNRGTGIASAPVADNYVVYKFEVVDGPVDYSITFDSDATGFLRIVTETGVPIVNISAGQSQNSFLDTGIYTLSTFLALQVTSDEGSRSGSNSFAMYFEDSTLNIDVDIDTDGDGVNDSADNCSLVSNPDQRDTNGDGFGNLCDPDFDNNGVVNFVDVNAWVPFFNTACGDVDFDLNGDGNCNFADYAIVTSFFLMPPGPGAAAP